MNDKERQEYLDKWIEKQYLKLERKGVKDENIEKQLNINDLNIEKKE
jgi:gamma-glutamylcysteine synthetase